jgi:hypothetical protein
VTRVAIICAIVALLFTTAWVAGLLSSERGLHALPVAVGAPLYVQPINHARIIPAQPYGGK